MEECCSKDRQCGSADPCYKNHAEECDKEEFFLELADEAWMEVLKDKIKEHILATKGEQMAELAKIISEGNNQRWKTKMEQKKNCAEFEEKLTHFFSQPKR